MWWLCRSGTQSCSPVYSQPGERYRQVQSGAPRSGARPVHGQRAAKALLGFMCLPFPSQAGHDSS